MGYRLFLAGIDREGSADVDGAGFRIRLAGYGPGVVVALFGALLISVAVSRDLVAEYERVNVPYGVMTERGRAEAAEALLVP